MTVDPLVLTAEVDRATERLLRTAGTLDRATLAEPSRLPDWSRGHVLTHVARSADALVTLLTGARTGRSIPAYPSVAARDADIAAGADRPIDAHLDDLRAGWLVGRDSGAGLTVTPIGPLPTPPDWI